MGLRERVIMVLESQAVSAWLTKFYFTLFSKHALNGVTTPPEATSYDKLM